MKRICKFISDYMGVLVLAVLLFFSNFSILKGTNIGVIGKKQAFSLKKMVTVWKECHIFASETILMALIVFLFT